MELGGGEGEKRIVNATAMVVPTLVRRQTPVFRMSTRGAAVHPNVQQRVVAQDPATAMVNGGEIQGVEVVENVATRYHVRVEISVGKKALTMLIPATTIVNQRPQMGRQKTIIVQGVQRSAVPRSS